jgi:hypothetical protein
MAMILRQWNPFVALFYLVHFLFGLIRILYYLKFSNFVQVQISYGLHRSFLNIEDTAMIHALFDSSRLPG